MSRIYSAFPPDGIVAHDALTWRVSEDEDDEEEEEKKKDEEGEEDEDEDQEEGYSV